MNPETQNTEALLARVTRRAENLADINADLLAALKDAADQIGFWRNTFEGARSEPTMPRIAPSETIIKNIAAAIAKAESSQ